MQITWQPAPLPADARDCGHGVGICTGSTADSERRLAAFVTGFAWFHTGADAVVHFVPALLPADAAEAQTVRDAFDAMLRARQLECPLPAGYHTVANC